jgi:FKBP-type peptidyl-prolyl cis-trans isomerase SlyD
VKISENKVVSIDYTLKNDAGEVLDTSEGEEPLEYLHGHGQIVPGLEKALAGKGHGDKVKVKVSPEEGYGERDPERIIRVPRSQLPQGLTPEVGMSLAAQGDDGELIPLRVAEVQNDAVLLDANHPLAGEALHFEVEIKSIREATSEELEHGHAHGPDGHHHDEE